MNVDTASLESMCELIVDCPHSTPKWTDSGVVVLRNQNIRNGQLELSSPSYTNEAGYQSRVKRAIPQVGDIIFTREAPMGEVCLIPSGLKCCLGQRQVLLRPKETVNGEYLYWALQSPFVQHQISWNEGTGTTVSNVRIPVLKSLQIPRRGSDEQKIADALSSLAHKIRLNHQINQTLEQMAQAIFKSWFVDFEPVKAKIAALEAGGSEEDALLAAMQIIAGDAQECANTAEGSTPETAIGGKLTRLQAEQPEQYAELRATAELFPSAMQDSELGEVPEGWSVLSLEDLCTTITKGTTPKKSEIAGASDPASVPFIKVKDIANTGEIVQEGLETIPDSINRKTLKRSILETGDLLFSIAGTIGRIAIVDAKLADSNTNQAVGIIRLKEPEKYLSLVWQLLLSTRTQNEIQSKVVQGVQANASLKNLRDIQVLLPCNHILKTANSQLDALLQVIANNRTQTRNLTEVKDALLPKLLSGELTIPDAESKLAKIEEAASV
jgi:type I restriction enzyme S subunit